MEKEIEVYRHEDHCNKIHCRHCSKCDAKYDFMENKYCRKCYKNITENIPKTMIYVNKKIVKIANRLTDLFCLDHEPIIVLHNGKHDHGYCHWSTTPIVIHLYLCNGKLSVHSLVHEFIHAMGYNHTWEINGWSNFRSRKDLDTFTPLIMKDLFGSKKDFEI